MQEVSTSLFPWLCRATMIQSRGDGAFEFDPWLERSNCPSRVTRILKSSVGAIVTPSGDYKFIVESFVASLRSRSVFARLLDSGMTRIRLRQRVGWASSDATAWIVGEAKPTPLSRIVLESAVLEPVRVCSLVVVTEEAARDVSAAGQTFFTSNLRGAISDVIDAAFFSILSDSLSTGSTIASSGNDAAAVQIDLHAALSAVEVAGNSSLFWIASQDTAKRMSVLTQQFPAMSPQGGEATNLPCLVSSAMTPGSLMLIDASQVAGDIDDISVRASNQADVEMLDSSLVGDASSGVGAQMVSMFMTNSLALLAETSFAAEVLREDAAATITDIAWGDGGTV